jgi:hypothetical protein
MRSLGVCQQSTLVMRYNKLQSTCVTLFTVSRLHLCYISIIEKPSGALFRRLTLVLLPSPASVFFSVGSKSLTVATEYRYSVL